MKKIFLLMLLLTFVTTSFAATCEKIILTNGLILEGYLSKQYPKESRVVFNVEKAVILLNDSIVAGITDKYYDLDSLTDEWKAYVDENPKVLVKSGSKKKLLLSSVNLQTNPNSEYLKQLGPLSSVLIIEHDASKRKLLCLNKCEYSVKLKDVQSIEPFYNEEKEGLMDVVVTKTGKKIDGHIYSRVIGKQIKIRTKDGINHVVSYKDLEAIKRRPLNLEKSIFEQYHYNEIVKKTNGQEYKGLIIQQNIGIELKDNYIMIQTSPYDCTTVFNSEIECLVKEPKEKSKQVKSKVQPQEKSSNPQKEVEKEPQKQDSISKNDKKGIFSTAVSSLPIKVCDKNVNMDKLAVSDDRYFFVPDDVEKITVYLDSIQNRFALSVSKTDTKRYKLIPAKMYQGSMRQQYGFKIKEKDSKKCEAYSENETSTGEKNFIFRVEIGMYILFCESNSSCVLCEIK